MILLALAIGLFIGASIGFILAAMLASTKNKDEVGPFERENTSPPHLPLDLSSPN